VGFGRAPETPNGRILVVEPDGEHPLGLLVEDASEVLRIAEESIVPPPELATGGASGAIRGVARLPDRVLLVLDLERVLADPTTPLQPPSIEAYAP
jgi:purine-binding chemotaxis protein CheW